MPTPPTFPVQLVLARAAVLVVGGGPVAARKAAALVAAGAEVTLVAPHVCAEVEAIPVTVARRAYEPGEAGRYRLVITATGDPAVDGAVAVDAARANVFVNAADDPEHCTFTLPAVARRGPITLTVATDGHSPLLAVAVRDAAAALVDDGVLRLAEALSAVRRRIQQHGGSTEAFDWKALVGEDVADAIGSGRAHDVADRLAAHLAQAQQDDLATAGRPR